MLNILCWLAICISSYWGIGSSPLPIFHYVVFSLLACLLSDMICISLSVTCLYNSFIVSYKKQTLILIKVHFSPCFSFIFVPLVPWSEKHSGTSSNMCGGVSPYQQVILGHWLGVLHSTQFWHRLPGNRIGSHRLRPQSHETASSSLAHFILSWVVTHASE